MGIKTLLLGGAGRKFQRSADETKKENEIPKVAATAGKIGKAPKKKRAPWDIKGIYIILYPNIEDSD